MLLRSFPALGFAVCRSTARGQDLRPDRSAGCEAAGQQAADDDRPNRLRHAGTIAYKKDGGRDRLSCLPYAKMNAAFIEADLSIRAQMPDSGAFRKSNAIGIGE